MKKTKRVVRPFPIYRVDRQYYGVKTLTREQMAQAKERLRWFEKRDEERAKTDKAKNDLESIIYAMRDWLSEDAHMAFVGREQVEALLEELRQEEDWLLEGEGEYATHVEYADKHRGLDKKYKQYKWRKEEYERRDAVVEGTR